MLQALPNCFAPHPSEVPPCGLLARTTNVI
jgi:hypothetical protein